MPAEAVDRFTIRPYQPGDESQILALFTQSFHVAQPVDLWSWKYARDPYGTGRISVAIDSEGRLVGHYAAYPIRFYAFGREVEAQQVGDTMTDPSIRHIGRGPTSILGRTALHFYDTFCAGQVAFNYGFNVSNIQKFSLRFLRSDRVEPVAYRSAPVAEIPRISRAERWARGYQFTVAGEANARWDSLFRRLAPDYRFLVRRDAAYVKWRYLDRPERPYVLVAIRKWRHLVGWLVFRIRGNKLTVGDLLIDPAHADAVEAVIRHLAHVYPIDSVDGWFPPRPPFLDEALRDARLELTPEPQDLSVMCVPFTWPEAPEEMRRSLYYTMGDSDLF